MGRHQVLGQFLRQLPCSKQARAESCRSIRSKKQPTAWSICADENDTASTVSAQLRLPYMVIDDVPRERAARISIVIVTRSSITSFIYLFLQSQFYAHALK